jgi:hypothetical protein
MKKCCAVIDTIWLVSARFSLLGKISFSPFCDVTHPHYIDVVTLLDGTNLRLNWNIESDMNVYWI